MTLSWNISYSCLIVQFRQQRTVLQKVLSTFTNIINSWTIRVRILITMIEGFHCKIKLWIVIKSGRKETFVPSTPLIKSTRQRSLWLLRNLQETNLLILKFGNFLRIKEIVISEKVLNKKKRLEDQNCKETNGFSPPVQTVVCIWPC